MSNTDSLETCSICYDNLQDEKKQEYKLSCNHIYHKKCISKWLSSHKTCPLCRAQVEPIKNNQTRIQKRINTCKIIFCIMIFATFHNVEAIYMIEQISNGIFDRDFERLLKGDFSIIISMAKKTLELYNNFL